MPIKGLYRHAGNGGEAALPVGVYSITTPPRNTVTTLKGVKMCKPNKVQALPNIFDGISVVYLDNESHNRYVKLSADQTLAKQLAKLLYHDIRTAISQEKQKEYAK